MAADGGGSACLKGWRCGHDFEPKSGAVGAACPCEANGVGGGARGGGKGEVRSSGEGPLMVAVVMLEGSAARERTGTGERWMRRAPSEPMPCFYRRRGGGGLGRGARIHAGYGGRDLWAQDERIKTSGCGAEALGRAGDAGEGARSRGSVVGGSGERRRRPAPSDGGGR